MSQIHIAQVGPAGYIHCGILDYANFLQLGFEKYVHCQYLSYDEALEQNNWEKFDAVYVHYERSLLPNIDKLKKLGAALGKKGFLIPHEIYEEDPFAFPYHKVDSKLAFLRALKKWLYRRKHQNFFQEKEIQKKNYFFENVVCLSRSNHKQLLAKGARPLDSIIPLAAPDAKNFGSPKATPQIFVANSSFSLRWIAVFGFINPANDYQILFDLLKELPSNFNLILIGGDKGNHQLLEDIKINVSNMGLGQRFYYTGYLQPDEITSYLQHCHFFICPFKHKSNSSSILQLFSFGKPIYGSKIPILEELKQMGAPIEIYQNVRDLKEKLLAQEQQAAAIENRYPYSLSKVCGEYLKIAGLDVNGDSQ